MPGGRDRLGEGPKRQAAEALKQHGWVLFYLDDIASDLSAFHRIDDAGRMEAAVFFTLAARLPAYSGVLAARLAAENRGKKPAARGRGGSVTYERGSGRENRASTADIAPPLTAGAAAALNMQLGAQFFRITKVTPEAVTAGG